MDDIDWYVRYLTEEYIPTAPVSCGHPALQDVGHRWDLFRQVLDGDPGAISQMFAWDETPHGNEFWEPQSCNARLSKEGRHVLETAIARVEERNGKKAEEATERTVSLLAEAMEIG